MTISEIIAILEKHSEIRIIKEDAIQNGIQIRLNNGGIINCYDNGNHQIQGKNIEQTKALIEGRAIEDIHNKKIFVVYGHDDIARTQLEAMLRRWDLEPIILDQQASGGNTIIEKLEEYGSEVQYAVVLATPDDEGRAVPRDGREDDYKKRVRQNVILELGMFLSKLGRERVAILLKEDSNFEKPSDIHGLVYIPFQNKVDEVSISLIRELAKQGYHIDSSRI